MLSHEVIWITGASSGIGQALARHLALLGNKVIVSARNVDSLNQLAQETSGIDVVPFDVTDAASIDSVRDQLRHCSEHLDRVILNAGTCEYLDIHQPDWSMMSRIMNVNFFGLVNSIEIALPLLKKAEKPHLVGISSQAIKAPFVRAEAYGASKAAVSYFLESLRADLIQLNIDVTEILPGFVDTPLTRKNDFSMPFLMPVDTAAQRMVAAIDRRPFSYAFPKRLSLMLWTARRFPKSWLRLQNREMHRTDHSDKEITQ